MPGIAGRTRLRHHRDDEMNTIVAKQVQQFAVALRVRPKLVACGFWCEVFRGLAGQSVCGSAPECTRVCLAEHPAVVTGNHEMIGHRHALEFRLIRRRGGSVTSNVAVLVCTGWAWSR